MEDYSTMAIEMAAYEEGKTQERERVLDILRAWTMLGAELDTEALLDSLIEQVKGSS